MEAAKVIAAAIDCDEKTVFRIIEDYEPASQLSPITLEAVLEQNIDPAAAKHARVVENLLRIPSRRRARKPQPSLPELSKRTCCKR
ncbi:MAG: hypothetical protein RB191_09405 [Terriglobia bacterium]|nr:hypothetical protein [Terriglobia bacterium]